MFHLVYCRFGRGRDNLSVGLLLCVHPSLPAQVFVPEQCSAVSFSLAVTDASRARRRLLFSSSFREPQANPLHAQYAARRSSGCRRTLGGACRVFLSGLSGRSGVSEAVFAEFRVFEER